MRLRRYREIEVPGLIASKLSLAPESALSPLPSQLVVKS